MIWYHPARCGDFSLESDGDAKSNLLVRDATPAEHRRLALFVAEAVTRGWTEPITIPEAGEATFPLSASIRDAGPVLSGMMAPSGGALTAVRSAAGVLTVDVDPGIALATAEAKAQAGPPASEGVPPGPDADTDVKAGDKKGKKAKADPKADKPSKAATVKRPTPCCPYNITGPEHRASEVLRAFCTQEQWESWEAEGWLVCVGEITRHRYLLMHRRSPMSARNGKIGRDLDDDVLMHFHDWSVPPAEEVLAAKLILEHKEPWLRNRSTCFGSRSGVFRNPLGHPTGDGTRDAALVHDIGVHAQSFIHGFMGAFSMTSRRRSREIAPLPPSA